MTSKLVVNTIEADTGISSVSFASSISMSSTSKFHFSAAGIDIDADTNINRPSAGVIGFNINGGEKVRIDSSGNLNQSGSGNVFHYINTGNNSGDNSQIAFGDSADADAAYINYDHGTNALQIRTNGGSNSLVIDSSGRIQIGSSTLAGQNNFNGVGRLNIQNNSADGTVDFSQGIVFTDNYSNEGSWTHGGIVCTGSTGYSGNLVFGTDGSNGRDMSASSITEKMRITAAGRMGLGKTSPSQLLHLRETGSNSTYIALEATTTTNNVGILLGDADDIDAGFLLYAHSDNSLRFGTNGAKERLRITSSGQTQIASTSPANRAQYNNFNGPGLLNINNNNADGTVDFTQGIVFTDQGASNTTWTHGGIVCTGSTGYNGNLVFGTDGDGTQNMTGITEKMRIAHDGKLLVGTTSSTAAPGSGTGYSNMCTFNFPGITLTHYGVVAGFTYGALTFTNSQYFVSNGTTGVYLGNGSTSWTAHSDERLKTNITELDGTKAYNHIKTARATSFKWNATGYPTDTKIGFIAQDWETNYPEVVNSTTETIDSVENPKGIQYTETVPVLMAALKQAISKIETLEAEVAALKSS